MHCQDARQPFSCWGAFPLLAHSDKSVALVQPITFVTHTHVWEYALRFTFGYARERTSQLACFPRGAVRPVSLTRGGSARGFACSRTWSHVAHRLPNLSARMGRTSTMAQGKQRGGGNEGQPPLAQPLCIPCIATPVFSIVLFLFFVMLFLDENAAIC